MTDLQKFKRTKYFKENQKEIKEFYDIILVDVFLTKDYIDRRFYFDRIGNKILETKMDWMSSMNKDPRRTVLLELL